MRILSIGNSFSQDAQAYLRDVAQSQGVQMECVNLYIGGCNLRQHWENAQSNAKAYARELNGDTENFRPSSIREALEEGSWDAITLQQASHDSGWYETYQPYLSCLSDYARKLAPGAKQWIHQTWAYEPDSDHPAFERYRHSQEEMYERLTDAYCRAAQSIGARLIPVGRVIQTLRRDPEWNKTLCRDGFHLSLTYGRYAAACAWFEMLTGRTIGEKCFVPQGCDPILAAKVRKIAHQIIIDANEEVQI